MKDKNITKVQLVINGINKEVADYLPVIKVAFAERIIVRYGQKG